MALKPCPVDANDRRLIDSASELFYDRITVGTTAKNIQFSEDIKGFSCYVSSGTLYATGATGISKEFLAASAASDAGGGKVQLAVSNSGFASGDVVVVSGTTNYDGSHTLTSGTSTSVIEFSDTFVAETPPATAYVTGTKWAQYPASSAFSVPIAIEADTTIAQWKTNSGTAVVEITAWR